LAILLLFFVGTVLAAQYHIDENNGNTSFDLGTAAARKKTASQGAALTSSRAARDAKTDEDKKRHQAQADAHTNDAASHKAAAYGHFQAAVGHYQR
jgi:hypothetical protein